MNKTRKKLLLLSTLAVATVLSCQASTLFWDWFWWNYNLGVKAGTFYTNW